MADPTYSAIVNRDDPIPTLIIPPAAASTPSPEPEEQKRSARETLRHHADSTKETLRHQADKLKEKIDDVREHRGQTNDAGFRDRLLNSYVVPLKL